MLGRGLSASYVRIVQQSHVELDWVARRRAGETARAIADRAGVPEEMVLVATDRLGARFDPPARQGTYSVLSVTLLKDRDRRWVEDRRRGVRVKDIAERDGVTHQSVTRATREWGPFPAQEHVNAWAAARSRGRTIRSIADEFAILPSVVQRLTASRGPFPRPSTGIPEGLETLQTIAASRGGHAQGPTPLGAPAASCGLGDAQGEAGLDVRHHRPMVRGSDPRPLRALRRQAGVAGDPPGAATCED